MLDDPAEEAAAQAIAVILREGRAKFAAVVAEHAAEVAALRVQGAELRAVIAEQRAEISSLAAKVDAKLASVKDGVAGDRGEVGPAGPPGDRGEKGDAGANAPSPTDEQIEAAVARYLSANPPAAGRDGADGQKGDVGPKGIDGKDGRDGIDGKDGVGIAGALIDRSGSLVVTLSNGMTTSLGAVVGRDGVDGAAGRDGAPGKDGDNGADGVIKLDLADVHKGPWKAGAFGRGNLVTMGGSTWLATADTQSRPGTDETWRLIVRAGRDGKDGRDLGPAPPVTVRA